MIRLVFHFVPLVLLVGAEQYCNDTKCSNFRSFNYNETVDLLSCECLPGWKGQCCQVETECANGRWNPAESICDCYDRHYEGRRCEVISCDNDGKFIPEELWASPNATGCSCYPGNFGDFCEKGGNVQSAGKTVRVRITTTQRSRSYSSWNRPVSSPHYHHTHINTYSSTNNGYNDSNTKSLVWLWVLIAFIVLFLVFVCIASCSNSTGTTSSSTTNHTHMNNINDTTVVYTGDNYGEKETTTVVEVEMSESEANELLNNPELAANYTSDYTDNDGYDTTTTIEIIRD